ncbi:MAG: tetrahydrodipicolinate N-succinyltransferase N-terminal domain-containing protein [Gammaproteobacteria bacterium]
MTSIWSIGIGLATPAPAEMQAQSWMEVWYPSVLLQPDSSQERLIRQLTNGRTGVLDDVPDELAAQVALWSAAGDTPIAIPPSVGRRQRICCVLEQDAAITSVAEAYLKLHLLSLRLVRPNSINLEGLFAALPNIAWTNQGPLYPSQVDSIRLQELEQGRTLWVHSLDKFPPLTQYIIPEGVRIADTARVRLGAWIGSGTTIMHSGSINFNAGTEQTAMIEGRVSAGVVIGSNSDLGGSASTMGRLSGGGTELVSMGSDCLLGANSGLGIALGNRCTVEAGLYITAGSKIRLLDAKRQLVKECKARELSGADDLLFWRNSITGAIECQQNQTDVSLNPDLHSHN